MANLGGDQRGLGEMLVGGLAQRVHVWSLRIGIDDLA
jgi:hypothetical protein